MTPYDEMAKGAFLTLIEHCKRQIRDSKDGCEGCIFFTEETGCIFGSGDLPNMWEFPNNHIKE